MTKSPASNTDTPWHRGDSLFDLRDGRPEDLLGLFEQDPPGEFDAKYLEPIPAFRSYVLCFEERSGSTMLASLLQKTGKLGRPSEFLNPRGAVQMFVGRCNARNLYEYFGYLRHEFSTSNGYFGMKSTYPDFQPLIQRRAIGKLLDPVQFIHLTRKDVLRQAVSSALARKRNYWHSYNGKATMPPDEELEIDEALVLRLVDQVLLERQSWERFFTLYGIEPLRITYEDLLDDHRAVLDSVFGYLGMAIDARRFHAEPETQRLSNEVNDRWVEEIRRSFSL